MTCPWQVHTGCSKSPSSPLCVEKELPRGFASQPPQGLWLCRLACSYLDPPSCSSWRRVMFAFFHSLGTSPTCHSLLKMIGSSFVMTLPSSFSTLGCILPGPLSSFTVGTASHPQTLLQAQGPGTPEGKPYWLKRQAEKDTEYLCLFHVTCH